MKTSTTSIRIIKSFKFTIQPSPFHKENKVATCATPGCTKTAVGTELTVGGENSYVVSSDATNTVLLAKYDLKSDGSSYTQDTSGTNTNIVMVNFYGTGNNYYWNGKVGSGLDYEGSYCTSSSETNCAYVYDSNAVNIYPVVESYANKIGNAAGITVTGKLMTYEQANSLSTSVRNDKNSTYYWLDSASSSNSVWGVGYNGGIFKCSAISTNSVRPVIIVSTSAL